MSESKTTLKLRAIEGQLMPDEDTFQARLRQAVFDGVRESDVTEVVKSIVEKAKQGDAQATRTFFDYILGGKTKPTNITVHNHFADVEQAAKAGKRGA